MYRQGKVSSLRLSPKLLDSTGLGKGPSSTQFPSLTAVMAQMGTAGLWKSRDAPRFVSDQRHPELPNPSAIISIRRHIPRDIPMWPRSHRVIGRTRNAAMTRVHASAAIKPPEPHALLLSSASRQTVGPRK